MAAAPTPSGELFSRVYLDRGKASQDSKKFRRRLCHFLTDSARGSQLAGNAIAIELGLKLPQYQTHWPKFFDTIEINDLLDSITLLYRGIGSVYENEAQKFLAFVERALREENLGYRLDERGGVHFFVDQEFESSRSSLLAGLHLPRYAAVREAFEAAHLSLGSAKPDTLSAVRRSFDAVENIFKLMFDVSRIGASEIKSKLKPFLDAKLSHRSADAAKLMAEALANWVNAVHQYRHAPNVPDPSPPPLGLALAMMGSAATYLRWLIELDSNSTE